MINGVTLIELVGPAGTGKSAVASALTGDHGSFGLWNQPRSSLVAGATDVAPAALAAARAGKPLVADELAQMVRLSAMQRTLSRANPDGAAMLVMDEGPVFALSWFEVFFGRNGDPGWRPWRQRMLQDWAARLDVVIRMDAPDEILARRIRERSKPHLVKRSPFAEICGFNARFREAFDRVIGEMMKAGNVQVIDIRTDALSPDELARRVAASVADGHGR